MKLLFILSEYLPESGGGIISYYAEILPQLVASGHAVDVLVASSTAMDRPEMVLDGVRISYLKSSYLRQSQKGFDRFRIGFPTCAAFLPVAWAAYEQAGHGSGYDIVETTDFALLFAPWVVSRDSPPVVVSLHGSCGQLDWYEHQGRKTMDGDFVRLIERSAFACTPSIYSNSRSNASFWESSTNRPVEILPPHAVLEEGHSARPITYVEEGVVVGRFQGWKGSRILCRALSLRTNEIVRWVGRDVIDPYGQLPQSALISSEFSGLIGSRLILTGELSRNEVMKQISNASYLCIPSEWDVFNLTAIEAMTLGTPVICSIRAGASMLIKHGENGYLFDPDHPEELAACMEEVRSMPEDQRSRLVARAREGIGSLLDPEKLMAERLSYYASVLQKARIWRSDDWLEDVLMPRKEAVDRRDMLMAFTVRELAQATTIQAVRGIIRRIKN